ncbi:MAG: hypothetical protein CMH83_00535 [Nocardioides sp.]|nr:hypothetical protein [Nocardioides sp.]
MNLQRTQPLRPARGRARAAAAVAVASALLLAGCGSDDDGSADSAADSSAESSSASGAATASESPTATATPTEETPATLVPGGSTMDDTGRVLPGEAVFSVLSPWNTPATDLGVQQYSDELLELAKQRLGVNNNGELERVTVDEGIFINTYAWTVPVVADGDPTVLHCRQVQCGDGKDDITLNVPDDLSPLPQYDGWYTIFDQANGKAYDLWRARREDDGVLSYGFMRQWDLDGPGFNQPYVVSSRGSGLPLFGGLIRSGELERGVINHALAISVPGAASGNFVQPASSTNGNGAENSLPMGARIVLKSDFKLRQPIDPSNGRPLKMSADQKRYARAVVKALKTYGAFVVDRSAVPTLYYERTADSFDDTNVNDRLLLGYEVRDIGLEDFQVADFAPSDRIPYPSEEESVNSSDLEEQGPILSEIPDTSGGQ